MGSWGQHKVEVVGVECGEQFCAGGLGAQAQREVGVAAGEGGQRAVEVERLDGVDRADTHLAAQHAGHLGGIDADAVDLVQYPAGPAEHELAGVGQRDATSGSGEQADAELAFQFS